MTRFLTQFSQRVHIKISNLAVLPSQCLCVYFPIRLSACNNSRKVERFFIKFYIGEIYEDLLT